jgi:head-tail adaptor
MRRLISAGTLRHRVTLETPGAPIPDPTGGGDFTQAWTVLGSRLPASVAPATARSLEQLRVNTVTSMATHLVTVRYLAGVTTQTRATFHDGDVDRVMSVTGTHDPEERHVVLILECVEQVL